jgi:hypothetical protein|uniref:Uncharacterized protein n=1 Tax=uncultured marine virus TaxID=186617 RepID=A0A0F7LA74_9VIRU|nr:hypothetical protein [uncultured marine virus]
MNDLKHELMTQISNMIMELNNDDFERISNRCDKIKQVIFNPDFTDKGDELE